VSTAFLGGGKMGEALLAGLIRGGTSAAEIRVVERDVERAAYLTRTYGISAVDTAEVAEAGTIVVAVKPPVVEELLASLGLRPDQLVVSVAAGISLAKLEAAAGKDVPVVRSMPNTPALVGQGMIAISAGSSATAVHLDDAERLLATAGKVVRVPESQLDAVTAVSGSGPAYFFLVVEALIDAGVVFGLPRALASELAVQTALGAATMMAETGEHPVALKEAVTSPGGTTIAALRALEAGGLRAAIADAVEAATRRSAELGG